MKLRTASIFGEWFRKYYLDVAVIFITLVFAFLSWDFYLKSDFAGTVLSEVMVVFCAVAFVLDLGFKDQEKKVKE